MIKIKDIYIKKDSIRISFVGGLYSAAYFKEPTIDELIEILKLMKKDD